MSQIHQTGKTSSALVAQLLRTNYELNLAVEKERAEKKSLKEVHELEKQNFLEVIFKMSKNSPVSTTPLIAYTEASIESSIESSLTPSEFPTEPTVQSTETLLTVAAPKSRDKVTYFRYILHQCL